MVQDPFEDNSPSMLNRIPEERQYTKHSGNKYQAQPRRNKPHSKPNSPKRKKKFTLYKVKNRFK
jgi:hypothetical protein